MPMPHAVQKQKIVERLKNFEGTTRSREIKKILQEIPQYKSGPYGELRGWLLGEIEKSRVKGKIKAREVFAIKKQGDFQICFLGQPSSGKTSLINALSGAALKIGDYAFTTLKPQAATTQIFGVDFQLLDLPGLIEGASIGKGFGKRVLGVVKNSDGIVIVADLSKPITELEQIMQELKNYGLEGLLSPQKTILVGNKIDLSNTQKSFEELKKKFPTYSIVSTSAFKKTNLKEVENAIWKLSCLIRVYSHNDNASKPIALYPPATVKNFAEKIHKGLAENFLYARIWGCSAKFPGQKVGLKHELEDNDCVEIVSKPV